MGAKFCEGCGAGLNPGDTFCSECGHRVSAEPQTPPTPSAPQPPPEASPTPPAPQQPAPAAAPPPQTLANPQVAIPRSPAGPAPGSGRNPVLVGVLAAVVVAAAGGGWWFMNQPKDDPAAPETPAAPGKASDPAPKPTQTKPPAKTPAKSPAANPSATPPKAPANPKTPAAAPPKTPPKSAPATPPKTPPVTTPPEVPPVAPPTANGDAFLGQWLPDDGSKVDPTTDLLRIVRRGSRLVGQIPDPEEGYLDLRATSASKLTGAFIGSDGTRMPVTMELLSKTRLMMTVVTPDGSVETVPLRRVGKVP